MLKICYKIQIQPFQNKSQDHSLERLQRDRWTIVSSFRWVGFYMGSIRWRTNKEETILDCFTLPKLHLHLHLSCNNSTLKLNKHFLSTLNWAETNRKVLSSVQSYKWYQFFRAEWMEKGGWRYECVYSFIKNTKNNNIVQ